MLVQSFYSQTSLFLYFICLICEIFVKEVLIIIKQMSTDFYNAPTHTNAMLNQLGIDENNVNQDINPANIPKQLGAQTAKKGNKYVQKFLQQAKQQQFDKYIPKTLPAVSMIQKKKQPQQKVEQSQVPKGRRKQSKRDQLKKNKGKNTQKQQNKQQIKMDVELDEVAQWGQKGTKVDKDEEQSQDFDEENEQHKGTTNNEQQQTIRKNIQQKLKKYENISSGNKAKNVTSSLQSKAEELKKKKQQAEKNQTKVAKDNKLQQSTHELIEKKQKIDVKQDVKQEEQQQSQDPWQKINKQTLAQKKGQAQAFKNAQQKDLNKHYQKLQLPQQQQMEEQEPKTGILQTVCACLSTKPKPNTLLEKQLLKISKIQLTNTPEEVMLLKTIWTKLTNKKYLRYGQHWNEIGFQGRDPATDLRSTGILSLLQWYNFLNFDQEYCNKMFNFCTQFDIPLALSHIKVTSLICSSIRKRSLSGKTWDDYLEWYYALCYYTFQYIMQNGKNLDQVGQLVQKSIQRTKNELQNAKKHFNLNIKSKR